MVGKLPRQKGVGSVAGKYINTCIQALTITQLDPQPQPQPQPSASPQPAAQPTHWALQTNIVTYVEGEVPCRVVESGKAATGKATAKQTTPKVCK